MFVEATALERAGMRGLVERQIGVSQSVRFVRRNIPGRTAGSI